MSTEKKKISIEDVAARAKVSITTVSRVLNKVSTVSARNVVKVEEAISFFKYRPNVSAQRLARGTNSSLGLVMPGYPGIFHSFYAIEIIRGVGHACEMMRLDMVFHITNGFNPLNTTNVGGVIFADIIENRKQIEAAIENETPCIVINNKVDDMDVSYIAVNNALGGEIAADYLSSLGHKRIATITGNVTTQAGHDRLHGFKSFLEKKKFSLPDEYIVHGDYSRGSARAATEKLFSLKNRPTAIFAASDEMALEACAVIFEKGLKVPEDISVIGFDDNPACLYGSVALTTIKQPLFQMAETAVKQLSAFVQGKSKTKDRIILSPELVVRESCSQPKN